MLWLEDYEDDIVSNSIDPEEVFVSTKTATYAQEEAYDIRLAHSEVFITEPPRKRV